MTARAESSVLEICVDGISDFDAAVDGGADRIELCAALEVEGLTPSRALLEHARGRVATVAMLRNRPGDFVLSARDVEAMRREARMLRELDVRAVVLGMLTPERRLDTSALRCMRDELGDEVDLVFHRAFDLVPASRHEEAFAAFAELGVSRVLTSGGPGSIAQHLESFTGIVDAARARGLHVLAGGGLRVEHIADLHRAGVREFHASARPRDADGSLSGGIDVEIVRALRRAIDGAASGGSAGGA